MLLSESVSIGSAEAHNVVAESGAVEEGDMGRLRCGRGTGLAIVAATKGGAGAATVADDEDCAIGGIPVS